MWAFFGVLSDHPLSSSSCASCLKPFPTWPFILPNPEFSRCCLDSRLFWFPPPPRSQSLSSGYVRIETRVRLRNFCVLLHSVWISQQKKQTSILSHCGQSKVVDAFRGTEELEQGWVRFLLVILFFKKNNTSADVFLFARVAQFFTLRE